MTAGAFSPLPSKSPKRSSWPEMLSRADWATLSSTAPDTAISERRVWPIESKAPALMRFSMARRLSSLPFMRRQKSSKSVKGPFAARSATSESIAPQPMPLMATSP